MSFCPGGTPSGFVILTSSLGWPPTPPPVERIEGPWRSGDGGRVPDSNRCAGIWNQRSKDRVQGPQGRGGGPQGPRPKFSAHSWGARAAGPERAGPLHGGSLTRRARDRGEEEGRFRKIRLVIKDINTIRVRSAMKFIKVTFAVEHLEKANSRKKSEIPPPTGGVTEQR